MPLLADDDEANGYHVDSIPPARRLGAVSAEEGGVSRILGPEARLPNQMAPRALEPTRKANADEFSGSRRVYAGRNLRRDRRQAEAVHPELLLKTRLVDGLWMPESRRWGPSIPLLKPSSDNRDSRTAIPASSEIDNRAGAVSNDDLAPPDVPELVAHLSLLQS